jgi:Arc/MetJ-type ribon-helix-helix transcriptional regulator
MADECKSPMISARLPRALVERVDFVTRNTEGDATNRSKAVRAALETWLPEEERRLKQLGLAPPEKAR